MAATKTKKRGTWTMKATFTTPAERAVSTPIPVRRAVLAALGAGSEPP